MAPEGWPTWSTLPTGQRVITCLLESEAPIASRSEALPAAPSACQSQVRPHTRAELLDGARNGDGILRIDNGTASDAVVALYDNEAQRSVRLMYVRSGTRTSAYGVPSAAYSIRFAFGRDFVSTEEGFCSDERRGCSARRRQSILPATIRARRTRRAGKRMEGRASSLSS